MFFPFSLYFNSLSLIKSVLDFPRLKIHHLVYQTKAVSSTHQPKLALYYQRIVEEVWTQKRGQYRELT